MKKNKGFTLIELLVVIAIIAILSTVVMAGLNSARTKGRDARRLGDVKALQTALELFSSYCDGYPVSGVGWVRNSVESGALYKTKTVITGGVNCTKTVGDFISPLPVDPSVGENGEGYIYCSANLNSTLPASGVKLATGNCHAAPLPDGGATSYRIGFKLEGQSGSLSSGYHTAYSGGII